MRLEQRHREHHELQIDFRRPVYFCRLRTVDMSFLYRFLYLVIIDVKITFATEFIKTLHKHIIVYEWMLNIST